MKQVTETMGKTFQSLITFVDKHSKTLAYILVFYAALRIISIPVKIALRIFKGKK